MVAHFPVAEKHFIERGDGLAGDITVAKQEAGRAWVRSSSLQNCALKRDGPQQLSQRLRLFDSALG
jgi:hypothetical protein